MRLIKKFGLIFIFLGVLLFLGSAKITGYSVFSGLGSATGSMLGVILIIAGILMWMSGRGGGGLEEVSEGGVKLIPTKKFLKAIKAHDKGRINNALARIGTGSKDEEKLKGRDDYSIRAGGGERVIFEYRGKEEAVLKDYHPDHDYDKSSR